MEIKELMGRLSINNLKALMIVLLCFILIFIFSITNHELIIFDKTTARKPQIISNWKDKVPFISVLEADCGKLLKNDSTAVSQAKIYQDDNPHIPVPDNVFIKQASDCTQFRKDRQYITEPLSREEAEFPIAYSILMYKDVEQAERLLRAIYHPQNYYCIHVDNKAKSTVKQAMGAIADCFDNVFIASYLIDVHWGGTTVIEPEIICMKDLWKYKTWKYFINLTGQEFPLKTNWEIVNILKLYNGTNDVRGTIKGLFHNRLKYVHQGLKKTKELKSPPTVNVNLIKGSVHISASRAFVDFMLHNEAALQFWEWVQDTGHASETYFNTLNYSPGLGVPGAYIGDPDTRSEKIPYLTRFKNWKDHPWPCGGIYARNICIFGVGDLPLLHRRPEMFANKFHSSYQPLAYSCLEEWHFSKMIQEVQGQRDYGIKSFDQYVNTFKYF